MKRARIAIGLGATAALVGGLSLLGASAANADGTPYWLVDPSDSAGNYPVAIPAGNDLQIYGFPYSDGTDAEDATLVITLETPSPRPADSPPAIGESPGTAGGTLILRREMPVPVEEWSTTLTIPADTPPGEGYNVCVVVTYPDSVRDLLCSAFNVLPALTSPTPDATPTPDASPTASDAPAPPPTPTTAPSSPAVEPAPSLTLTQTTTVPGGTLSLAARGFAPGETVSVVAHSDPVRLGSLTADETGTVSGSVTLPAGFPVGAHTLELTGTTSGVVVSTAFTVGTVPHAATDMVLAPQGQGASVALVAVLASAAVTAAGLARVLRRHRATA